ncbi:hypothetical protein PNOK_0715000 [Pyrrhoderma noxium]|uniref:MARVEL domain-containing protein n=1 Tax=Pyrrhoderma noxium TaxID=2282107 RepID=A0A286UBZ9_9AGAM|nr:hypothetical protein PNOK_0715000 [Pyrrhoderma noxium]
MGGSSDHEYSYLSGTHTCPDYCCCYYSSTLIVSAPSLKMQTLAFSVLRFCLYYAFWLFSLVLLGLTAARLHYTTHLPPTDPLNRGQPFYDPIVAELAVCSILGIFWAPFIVHMIHAKYEHKYFSRVWHELLGLFTLNILWLVGAAISTNIWPNLPAFCSQFQACRILTAMLAFAWMGWIMLTTLIFVTVLYASANGAWHEPAHGYWIRELPSNARASEYSQHTVRV